MAICWQRKGAQAQDFPMAPMVDMVFLLLVFFMCVTAVSGGRARMKVDLPQTVAANAATGLANTANAGAQTGTVASDGAQVVLSLAPDGLLAVNGVMCERGQLAALLRDLSRRADGRELSVRIRAYAQAPYSEISPLLSACAAAGIARISYAAHEADITVLAQAEGAAQ